MNHSRDDLILQGSLYSTCVCVCACLGALMVHEMMSSLASPQDKPHDGTIIISVSYMTATKDICESNH